MKVVLKNKKQFEKLRKKFKNGCNKNEERNNWRM